MSLKQRLSKLEAISGPAKEPWTIVFRDEEGVTRDTNGNILTGRPSGTVIVLNERIRSV